MLGGLIRLLREGVPGRARDPGTLVILNFNSTDPRQPGDVSFLREPASLVRELRGIDLAEPGYLAIDSSGRQIEMSSSGSTPDDGIEIAVAAHPTEAQLAQRLIKHYLLAEIADDGVALDPHAVEREHRTHVLLSMLPPSAVEP